MSRFNAATRRRIIEEFTQKHGGSYDPKLFLEEIRLVGESHPAYSYFEWDDRKAAYQYRLDQARQFAQGIIVTYAVKESIRSKVVVRQVEAPMLISTVANRAEGGGYHLVDLNNPNDVDEICFQARQSLQAWAKRFGGVFTNAGGDLRVIDQICAVLGQSAQTEMLQAAE